MDTCVNCGEQIWFQEKVWQDNSGGDICGIDGTNSPHKGYSDLTDEEVMDMDKERN